METKYCVVAVTGGASGLGEATVCDLVEHGAKVSILDFDDKKGEKLAAALGDGVIFCKTDVTVENSVLEALDKTMDAFGAIHVAVNCAGVGTPMKVLGKNGPMPIDSFNKVVQVNLVGTMNVIRLAAGNMARNTPNKDGEKGVVINVASAAAFEGQIGQAAYSASKGGIVSMTLPIAREFAEYGIRVMTVAPGLFHTPMLASLPENVQEALAKTVPFPKRLGHPSEFAMLVRHIIENSMLNGETIRLDGAIRMQPR
ncbi:MAG: 3-hydroxyacyl-CoA dehydrogenase [Syntrophobacteraceae bacterium]|jgi:NAD(P)-dependent dehydrogenase (short-subunit alcohol dehydrogenase family)